MCTCVSILMHVCVYACVYGCMHFACASYCDTFKYAHALVYNMCICCEEHYYAHVVLSMFLASHVFALMYPASTFGKSGCFMKYTVESPGCFASSNFFLSSLSDFAKASPNLVLRFLNCSRMYLPFFRWDNCLFEFITKADSSQFSPAVSHSSNRVGIIVRSQFGHVYRQTTI